jgi:outer membrane protein insertion porin family
LFDRNIAIGFDVFRRDLNYFNFLGTGERITTYDQTTTGGQIRMGVPLTEQMQLALRYGLNYDEIGIDPTSNFTDPDGAGPLPAVCDPLKASRYLCDTIGNRLSSILGYSLVWDTLNNRLRPSSGERIVFSQDFAGLGGDTRYLRSRLNAAKYWNVFNNFIFSVSAEGGYIHPFENGGPGRDPVRLTDRFFLGNPQIRGFDIRGVGPRVRRELYLADYDATTGVATNIRLNDDPNTISDQAIGGRAYYLARAELEIPLGASVRELGLRPSIFVDVGALWNVRQPSLLDIDPNNALTYNECVDTTTQAVTLRRTTCTGTESITRGAITPFRESFLGNSPSPRVSIGFGVNWNSPFGPFRIDIAHALRRVEGDDTKLFSFNVGTAF